MASARGQQTITQRIALDGGKQIEAELKGLGAAGERAFLQLRAAVATANGPLAALNAQIVAMRASFVSVGAAAGQFGAAIASTSTRIVALGVAALGAAAGLAAIAKSGLNAADEAGKAAQALGVTAQQYAQLSALADLAGVDARELAKAMGELNQSAAKAGTGLGAAQQGLSRMGGAAQQIVPQVGQFFSFFESGARRSVLVTEENIAKLNQLAAVAGKAGDRQLDALRKLGVNPAGKSNLQLLEALIDAFQKLPDGAQKSAAAMDIFGDRIGARLIPLLNTGRQGVQALNEELKQLGIGVDPQIERLRTQVAEKFNDTIRLLQLGFQRLREDSAIAFAAAFQHPLEELVEVFKRNRQAMADVLNGWATDVGLWAKDMVNAFLFVRDEVGNIKFINEDQVSSASILKFRDDVIAAGNTIAFVWNNVVVPAFTAVRIAADGLAVAFNAVFGTQFTGTGLIIAGILLKITGGFRLLRTAIALVVTSISAFSAVLTVLRTAFAILLPASVTAALASLPALFAGASAGAVGLGATIGRVAVAVAAAIAGFVSVPGLIVVALATAVTLIIAFWDDIVAFGAAAFEKIKVMAGQIWEGFTTIVQSVWDGVVAIATSAWAAITTVASDAINGIKTALGDVFSGLLGLAQSVFGSIFSLIGSLLSTAATGIVNLVQGAFAGIQSAAALVASSIQTVISLIQTFGGAQSLVEGIAEPFRRLADFLANQFVSSVSNVASVVRSLMESMASSVESAASRMIAAAQAAAAAIASIPSGGSSSGGDGGQTTDFASPNFARGGMVRGPGTGTSDSIPAWLSKGEFVVRAAAVQRYGLGVLRAINGMRLSPRQMRKWGMPAFAMGGLVDGAFRSVTATPAQSLPGKSFDLVIGTERFTGLFAPEDAASKLQRWAAQQQARSAGRKPAWYGG